MIEADIDPDGMGPLAIQSEGTQVATARELDAEDRCDLAVNGGGRYVYTETHFAWVDEMHVRSDSTSGVV